MKVDRDRLARKLRELKADATLLPVFTLEDQARFIGDRWLRFQREENTRWAG